MSKPDISKQTDHSDENLQALQLLNDCIQKGYTIRIDGLEITEYPDEKIISLKPSESPPKSKETNDGLI